MTLPVLYSHVTICSEVVKQTLEVLSVAYSSIKKVYHFFDY